MRPCSSKGKGPRRDDGSLCRQCSGPPGFDAVKGKKAFAPYTSWINNANVVSESKLLDYLNKNTGSVLQIKATKITSETGNIIFNGKTLLIWEWDQDIRNFKIRLEMYNSNQ